MPKYLKYKTNHSKIRCFFAMFLILSVALPNFFVFAANVSAEDGTTISAEKPLVSDLNDESRKESVESNQASPNVNTSNSSSESPLPDQNQTGSPSSSKVSPDPTLQSTGFFYSVILNQPAINNLHVSIDGNGLANPYVGNPHDINGSHDVFVDWGDGYIDETSDHSFVDPDGVGGQRTFFGTWSNDHTYTAPGTYEIAVFLYHANPQGNERSAEERSTVVVPPNSIPHTGSITICKMIADTDNHIATSSENLPEGIFGVHLSTFNNGQHIASSTFSAQSFVPNTSIISGNTNDAVCTTYNNLQIINHGYRYSEESITGSTTAWFVPKYNDQFTIQIQNLNDFFFYDHKNENSDGQIVLTENRPNRTLVVLNRHDAGTTTPPVNQPPTITLLGPNPMTLTIGQTFTDPGATAFDPEDGDLTASIVATGTVNVNIVGSYLRTYSVTDSGGLGATTTRTVNVTDKGGNDYGSITICKIISDTNNHIATSSANLPLGMFNLSLTASTTAVGEVTFDAANFIPNANFILTIPGDVNHDNVVDVNDMLKVINDWGVCTIDNNCPSDINGDGLINRADLDIVIANWGMTGSVNDSRCQTFNNLTVQRDYHWSEESITHTSSSCPWLSPKYNDQNNIPVISLKDFFLFNPSELNADGLITLTPNRPNQTLAVLNRFDAGTTTPPVNQPPTITLLGPNPMTLTIGQTFTDPGATAFDPEDGDLTASIVATGTVNVNAVGAYLRTYSVTDSGGLQATTTRTVNVESEPVTPPSPSGGGSSSGGGGSFYQTGLVLGATADNCFYLRDHLKRGWQNNRVEVLKLQYFLRDLEGFATLTPTGVFDNATYMAVSTFQNKYKDDVLTPWGHTLPTGFVYILTKKKVNEIYCKKALPVTITEQSEIDNFRSFLKNLRTAGIILPEGLAQSQSGIGGGSLDSGVLGIQKIKETLTKVQGEISATSTSAALAEGILPVEKSKLGALASALFSVPKTRSELLQSLYYLIISIIAVYLLAEVIIGSLNNSKLSRYQIWSRKSMLYIAGLILAIVVAYWYQILSIIVPLIVLIIASATFLIWSQTRQEEVRGVLNPPPHTT